MESETDPLPAALNLLREQFQGHRKIGQDQFFGLRRRVIRSCGRLYSLIEWYNALGGEKGMLLRVPISEEDAVVLVLHGELLKLRKTLPRVLPKAFKAPSRVPLPGNARS
jgi:hypothetical protein